MKFASKNVEQKFSEYPIAFRSKLLLLRELIFEVARENKSTIGEIEEALKWGEPSYLPVLKKVGTTVRINWLKSKPDQYGIYFHCRTNLIEKFKLIYGDKFIYEGNRAIIFRKKNLVPKKELKQCILMALTYHLD
ncbi:MAG: DUF1801 domain-containing protein [Bdellovibrionales bacterium]